MSQASPAPEHSAFKALIAVGVSFSLKAGDDCLYLDGPDWMNRDASNGETLVPVFCPARGAGWASLDFLKQNNP
jgi:hypothetical protein